MILTVTYNPAVDHTITVEEFPGPGDVARTDTDRFDAGGKGINVSKYLTGLGQETVATGLLGGFLAAFIERTLEGDGVRSDFVSIDGRTRLNTTILAEDERKINHSGPRVSAGVVDELIERIRAHEPDTVVLSGSLPPGLDHGALDRIAAAGDWRTAVDVDGPTLAVLQAEYALCKPNREELAAATGRPVDTVEDCIDAANALVGAGFDRVVASLGADGAILVTATEAVHVPARPVDVVDTVGAGDALLSGVLDALSAGSSDREALQHGVDVATAVVAVPGTEVPVFERLGD